MTDLTSTSTPAASLAARPPAASVIAQCLSEQDKLRGRKRIADFLGLSPLAADAVPWFTGALGELAVGRELARLDAGDGWVVLHSVPVGSRDSDIDHVVVGPPGVFTINTKHHSGQRVSTGRSQIFVSGQATPYIRNSVFEAERASKRLSEAVGFPVAARSVLAFVDPKELAGKRELDGVHIVNAAALARWLTKQPAMWEPDVCAVVARAAQLPSTWRAEGSPAFDEQNVTRFDELRRSVATMRRVRGLWALGSVLAVMAAAWSILQIAVHLG